MNRRMFLLALGAAVGGVSACNGTGVPAKTSRGAVAALTVGLTYTPDIQFAPFYVAAERGYFSAEGLNVNLRHHGANEQLVGALQSGAEHVVYAGGDEMMQARSQGVPVVDFATIYQQYPVVLLTKEDSPIRTAGDLRGRGVGVPGPYGETWFGLLVLLKQAGLSLSDVQVKNIGYTQQSALTSGQLDAVMGFANNDAVRLTASGVKVRQVPIATGPSPLVGIGLGATEETITNRADDLKGLTRAVSRAVRDIVADPEGAVKLSQKYVPNLSVPEQQQAALGTLRATIPLFGDTAAVGRQDAAAWQAMSGFMQEMGLLTKPVPAAEAYTDKILG